MSYKVVPIPTEIAVCVRKNLKSPQYGHPASISIAMGYGPCRSCLDVFKEGEEERILFTYNSFEGLSDLPLPGPIFIHKETCEEFQSDAFPDKIRNLPIIFEAFADKSELVKREPIKRENVDGQINELLGLDGVKFINMRNAEAGCFIARIDLV